MIHRKESGQLKAKAGLGIVDNILSTLSNHPISNRACALKFGEVDTKLSNRTPYPDYSTMEEVAYSTTSNPSEYTVDEDGFIVFQGCSAWNVPQGFINPSASTTHATWQIQIANASAYPMSVTSAPYPVKKGDIVRVNNNGSGNGSFIRAYFIKNR